MLLFAAMLVRARETASMLSVFYEVFHSQKNKNIFKLADASMPIEKWQKLLAREHAWVAKHFSAESIRKKEG